MSTHTTGMRSLSRVVCILARADGSVAHSQNSRLDTAMFSISTPDTDGFSTLLPSVPLCRTPDAPEKIVRIMAGTVTLTGLALGAFVHPAGYLLTAFAGVNILQSAFTGFCPPEIVYRWWTQSEPESQPSAARSTAE